MKRVLGLLSDNKWKRKVTRRHWATPLLPALKLLRRLWWYLDTAAPPLLSRTRSPCSGTSSERARGVIYISLLFPTSEIATKLNGNLTFSITICLIGHLVPFPSARQVLIPAKNPRNPLCPLSGQPVETEAQSDHSR